MQKGGANNHLTNQEANPDYSTFQVKLTVIANSTLIDTSLSLKAPPQPPYCQS